MLQTYPFWLDDVGPGREQVSELPDTTQAAIIGSGYTGLNAARELRHQGLDVVVLDRGAIGGGASSVNAGQLFPGYKLPIQQVFDRFGAEMGRRLWDASLAAIDLVESLVADLGTSCEFERAGAARLGASKRSLRAFEAEANWMEAQLAFPTRIVGPSRISDIAATAGFTAALVDDVSATLHPAKYARELARAAAAAGAHLVAEADVRSISRHTRGYQLLTAKGKLSAEVVLLATNGYTATRPVPELRRRVLPVGSYAIVTETLPPDQARTLIPQRRALRTAGRDGRFFRLTPDDRLLVSGSYNLSTELDLVESAARLEGELREAFPQLAGVAITHSWGGPLGVSFDLVPHLGRIDGMWYAVGYSGHGAALSTYLGVEAARRIGGGTAISPFEEIPHPTRPYYRHEPWFQPATARWHRFLDAIGR